MKLAQSSSAMSQAVRRLDRRPRLRPESAVMEKRSGGLCGRCDGSNARHRSREPGGTSARGLRGDCLWKNEARVCFKNEKTRPCALRRTAEQDAIRRPSRAKAAAPASMGAFEAPGRACKRGAATFAATAPAERAATLVLWLDRRRRPLLLPTWPWQGACAPHSSPTALLPLRCE